MSNLNPLNAYRETNIKTASQGKLIIMLYDEAIKQLNSAVSMIENKELKVDAINNSIIRSQEMITELMVSLDFEKGGEIAQTLFSLYMYFNRQLMEANLKKDPEPLKQISQMLAELRGSWAQIVQTEKGGTARTGGVNIAG
ncbi:MAG: flagellar export chaperone FliS [Spirochaetales bacterium]|nr:flagellar export chaperone FliS [Spirochaetales bacterium]